MEAFVEFIDEKDIVDLFDQKNITLGQEEKDLVHLNIDSKKYPIVFFLKQTESTEKQLDNVFLLNEEEIQRAVDSILHALHQSQTILKPTGRWRSVFDIVAFSLADDEEWQRFDAAATVELNTRDPLLCSLGDMSVISRLLSALIKDADQDDQGLYLIPTGAPVSIEFIPGSGVKIYIANELFADQIRVAIQG